MQLSRPYDVEELELLEPGTEREGELASPEDVSRRRNVRRAARLSEISKRNDSGLLLGVLGAVLAVPFAVLAVAWANGWLLTAL